MPTDVVHAAVDAQSDIAAWVLAADSTASFTHTHHGSDYLALVYTDRIAELAAKSSTGSVGDSYE